MSVTSVLKVKAIFNVLFMFYGSFWGVKKGLSINIYGVWVFIGLRWLRGKVSRCIFWGKA